MMKKIVSRLKSLSLFVKILAAFAVVFIIAAIIVNMYISSRLSEYERAQPIHLAGEIFSEKLQNPDFASLIAETGYELADGESMENAVAYFTGLTRGADIDFVKAPSVFELNKSALVYAVRAGGKIFAKFTLEPSGDKTKHGSVRYKRGTITLLRKERPAPPALTPELSPTPELTSEPTPTPPQYSASLRAAYSDFVLEATKTYAKKARSHATIKDALKFFFPGTEIYKGITESTFTFTPTYDSYTIENEYAGEFIAISDDEFTCRTAFDFRMKKAGHADLVESSAYNLTLRRNDNGTFLIIDLWMLDTDKFVREEEPMKADQITATVTSLKAKGVSAVIDDNRATKYSSENDLKIVCSEEFTRLYIIWDTPPKDAKITCDGFSVELGQNGFLHELVTLPKGVTNAVLNISRKETICDVYLFSDGVLPDWVQIWSPPVEKADLLAFSTHADDEMLFFGGILPTYAGERQMSVQVVYMTNHRKQNPVRSHELLDGLWTVGVTAYPIIGPFSDDVKSKSSLAAAEKLYGRDKVLEYQVEQLRRFKPSVIVGQDFYGEYGHGAHILNALTLSDALEICSNASYFPESAAEYGVWDVPKAYFHLFEENEIIMNWNKPLSRFGGATAFEMAEKGFEKHVSQFNDFRVRQDGTWHDCRKFGLYRSLVGFDVIKEDLFENIS